MPIKQVLALANTKNAPWIRKSRSISNRRTIYSVRSDFLVHYTDIWYRNRYPDTERVIEIMRSIEQEGETDNRIYLALITGGKKLMCFDGNHRREALIRLYYTKGLTCWVDLDILIDVEDVDVIDAFRRINMGVSVSNIYIEEMEYEANIPIKETVVYTCEEFIDQFNKTWNSVIVDRMKTRAPYCTKNRFIEIIRPYVKVCSCDVLMDLFTVINEENKEYIDTNEIDTPIARTCRTIDSYIFYFGITSIKTRLQQFRL